MNRTVKYVLWDFGDTLVDERWMRSEPEGIQGWSEVYTEAIHELGGRWNLGEISFRYLAQHLSASLGVSESAVMDHMRSRCCRITFFQTVYAAAKGSPLRKAIVTVNPDVFSVWVVQLSAYSCLCCKECAHACHGCIS